METLIKVKNKLTDDIMFLIKDAPKRYIEGVEFVKVKRHETDKLSNYIRRDSLIFNWK